MTTNAELLRQARALDQKLISEARDFAKRWQRDRERLHEMLGTLSVDLGGFGSHGTCVGQSARGAPPFEAMERSVKIADEYADRALREPEPYYDARECGPLPAPQVDREGGYDRQTREIIEAQTNSPQWRAALGLPPPPLADED